MSDADSRPPAARRLSELLVVVEGLLIETDDAPCATTDDVQGCRLFEEFAEREPVPAELLRRGAPASNLLRFITATPARAKRRALDEAARRADATDAVAAWRDAARAEVDDLIEANAPSLAASDHLPVRAELRARVAGAPGASGTCDRMRVRVRVASHNVQELCLDGVNTYAAAVPLGGTRGGGSRGARVAKLTEAMLSPAARASQLAAVIDLIEAEIDGARSDAVCLQEVSNDLAAGLTAEAARRRWHVHVSDAPQPQPRRGACAARTAIVSGWPLCAEPDVTVRYGKRARRYAAAVVELPADALHGGGASAGPPPGVIVVSVHAMHARGVHSSRRAEQPDNAEHVRMLEAEIHAVYARRVARGGTLLIAAGDWNCDIACHVDDRVDGHVDGASSDNDRRAAVEAHGGHADVTCSDVRAASLRVLRASPNEQTQYATPHAVDGALALVPVVTEPGCAAEDAPGPDEDARLVCAVVSP